MIALEFSTFLGRFHPLFVHLPIGFLLLAILLEWYQAITKKKRKSRLIAFAWLLGAVSAFAAALCGWFLGESGSYQDDSLFVHRWLGIALVVVAFIGWRIKYKSDNFSNVVHNGTNIVLLLMLTIEGHKGGNLTHGENYLVEYAPAPIQNMLGVVQREEKLPQLSSPDSVTVYADMIHPILETKCISCHSDEVQRGGLNLATPELLQEGGENGPVVEASQPTESELFRRVTLPQKNTKYMPPKGEPMTYDEIKVMEWWIAQGAPFDKKLSDLEIPNTIKPTILRLYGLDTEPKPWYETVQLAPLDSTQIENLRSVGFSVRTLGGKNPLLDVKYSNTNLTKEQLMELDKVKEHITWLSLAGSNVEDEWLSIVGNFENLTRLQLEKTDISDKGVGMLSNLSHIETLNLYGTKVTDSCLADLEKMEGLRRVYLWRTGVSPEDAKKLQEEKAELQVIGGKT